MKYDPRLATLFRPDTLPEPQMGQRGKADSLSQVLASPKLWTAEALGHFMSFQMLDDQIIVVSNRQPFTHEIKDNQVTLVQPASGLVTALEPIVRACDGTWIAHGNGVCDRDFVDVNDRCPAPVGTGNYTLRRLWLNAQEQNGYCDGFANSGLWPLCHMVHVKPVFRQADWDQYCAVNARFAAAVVQEASGPDPIVLVQDYHLALVPQLLRAQLPNATIVSFWHIPWTHPEQMAVCPWLPALLDGLLGSDIVGFQTPQHVRNFVELAQGSSRAVDRTQPVVVNQRSHQTQHTDDTNNTHNHKTHNTHKTQVRDYPISIAWPTDKQDTALSNVKGCRSRAQAKWSLGPLGKLVIGVDRFDYTKGIIERLHAFEQLLLSHPEWLGRVRFVQVAAPTRGCIPQYADYQDQVMREVQRINNRFDGIDHAPVVLLDTQHDRLALDELYRAADVCLVGSLHDGMNLVSKEFVAAKCDDQGVLVLSQFAGSANELGGALIVNPYHTVQVAAALHQALTMPEDEQKKRMRAMRLQVKNANVYLWAANMLSDASALRSPYRQPSEKLLSPSCSLLAHFGMTSA